MKRPKLGTIISSGAITVFLCSCFFMGCRTVIRDTRYNETPVFNRYDTIQSTVLTTDLEVNYPKQMFFIDSIIGVVDANATHDYYVHLYNERGELLKKIARKGRGPGELTGYSECFVDKKNNSISFFCQTKIVEYNLELLFGGSTIYYHDREIPEIEYAWLNNCFWLDENRFFGSGRAEDRRFILHTGKILTEYGDYPKIADNPEHNRAIFGSYTVMGFDDAHKRFVQGTYIGGILDIFQITDKNSIAPLHTTYLYKPLYESVDQAPSHISWGNETTIGFHALDCSNRYIYTLLNGVKGSAFKEIDAIFDPPYPNHISIFDWNGQPIRSVVLDKKVSAIAIKDDNTAYLVASDGGYYSLIKVSL